MSWATKWHSFLYDRSPPGRTLEAAQARWKDRTDCARGTRTLAQMPRYVAELRALFQEFRPQRVLEIGCGDGTLFAELGFHETRYRGVDFSPAMLCAFRSRFPNVDVVETDGSSYNDEQTYDLIFSNEVVQNFDPKMLEQHLSAARRMLAPEGRLIIASVLWRARRREYCSGKYDADATAMQKIRSHLRVLLGMWIVGPWWYDPSQFKALARRHGLKMEVFGSMVCMYRFHAVFQLR
jgi:SAM-dependent methyltransferase